MKFEKIKGAQNHHLFKPFDKKTGQYRDVFWIRYYKAGKGRLEESLKTNILSDARILRDKRIAEFLGQKPRFVGKGILVEDKFEDFLATKKPKAKNTFDAYEREWRNHLKEHFGGMLLEDVTETEWVKWVMKVRKDWPDRVFNNPRATLRGFLHWCVRNDFLTKAPRLENVDKARNAGKVYTDDEIKRLLKAADPRTRLQILMGCEMFMRRGEVTNLQWFQVNFEKNTIHLPAEKTKIRKARTFAISKNVRKGLLAIASEDRQPEGFVFASPEFKDRAMVRSASFYTWDQAREAAGVEGRFHDLRHTGLTRAFKSKKANPALICDYAGLSLVEAQKTYLHFTFEDTRFIADLVRIS